MVHVKWHKTPVRKKNDRCQWNEETTKKLKKIVYRTFFKNFRMATMIGCSTTLLSNIDVMHIFLSITNICWELDAKNELTHFPPPWLCDLSCEWTRVFWGAIGIVWCNPKGICVGRVVFNLDGLVTFHCNSNCDEDLVLLLNRDHHVRMCFAVTTFFYWSEL